MEKVRALRRGADGLLHWEWVEPTPVKPMIQGITCAYCGTTHRLGQCQYAEAVVDSYRR